MTIDTTNHAAEADVTDSTHESETERESWGVRVPFIIIFGIATILVCILLGALGAVGSYQYDDVMQIILIVFNVVIMAIGPIPALIRNQQHRKVNWAVRGGIMALLFIYLLFIFPTLLHLTGDINGDPGYVSTQWSVPFVGAIILPPLAVLVNAVAAYLLMLYPKVDSNLGVAERELPGRKTNVDTAQTELDDATNEHEAADALVKKGEPIYEAAKTKMDNAATEVTKTKEKLETGDLWKQKVTLEGQKATNQTLREAKTGEINQQKLLVDAATDSTKKAGLAAVHTTLVAELSALVDDRDKIQRELDALQTKIDGSADKRAYDAALAESALAVDEERVAREEFELLTKPRDAAATKVRLASGKHTIADAKHKKVDDQINDSAQAFRLLIRDYVLLPVVAAILLILAFGPLYPLWYGYVLVNFG